MNIILFIHKDSLQKGTTLKNAIEDNNRDDNLQIYETFNSLKSRLKKSCGDGNRQNDR